MKSIFLELRKGGEVLQEIEIARDLSGVSFYQYVKTLFASLHRRAYNLDCDRHQIAIDKFRESKGTPFNQEDDLLEEFANTVLEIDVNGEIQEITYEDALGRRKDLIHDMELVKQIVHSFYEIDKGVLGMIPVGDLSIDDVADIKDIELSLTDLAGRARYVVNAYSPKDSERDPSFEYRGRKFTIPRVIRDQVLNKDVVPDISTDQYLRALKISRTYDRQKKKIGHEYNHLENYEHNANQEYTKCLYKLALFAVEEGGEMPTGDVETDRWLDDRIRFFDGMDEEGNDVTRPIGMIPALEAIFFLINLKKPSQMQKIADTFSTLLNSDEGIKRVARTMIPAMDSLKK